MTELEQLQLKRREVMARKREALKERKQRTRRLIERGAILEKTLHMIAPKDQLSNQEIEKIVNFAILRPETLQYLEEMGL
jgi:hypothetical protein